MGKVEYLERQIRKLTAAEFTELRNWVLSQDWDTWDRRIESDVRAGKFDELVAQAQADYTARRDKAL